ncbi:uncharacterized protein V6R79_012556 [Siganus canaliculatus]
MDSAEIDAWCKRKQLACENAIVLSDVNSDVTDDVLIQALSQVKAFGDKVWLASVPDADPVPSRRVLRRRRKKQNTEKTQEIDKESETVENRLDATARTDDTDSESEEHGMWFDLFVEPPRIKMDEKVSEPFSLDLDVLASDQTGQPEEVEPEAIQEGEGNDVGCEETVNDTETQETSQTENQIQGHETADADTLSQEDTVTDTDNNTVTRRTQRVRRPPLKLTYDVPGQPSVKMAPSVKYVSCLYKWIGVPMETSFVGFFPTYRSLVILSAFGRWCLLDWCLLDWCSLDRCTELSGGGSDMDWEEENASEATIAKLLVLFVDKVSKDVCKHSHSSATNVKHRHSFAMFLDQSSITNRASPVRTRLVLVNVSNKAEGRVQGLMDRGLSTSSHQGPTRSCSTPDEC